MIKLNVILGLIKKDLKVTRRDPVTFTAACMAPLILLFISVILFSGDGDKWPIGLVVESEGPYSQELVEEIQSAKSNISPYFAIITMDKDKANELAHKGRLTMVINIPEDFDEKFAKSNSPSIKTYQYNVNTDMSKNTRLRLEHVLRNFQDKYAGESIKNDLVSPEFQTTFSDDTPRKTYIALGVLIFSLMFGGVVFGSSIVVQEWEETTIKEVLLSPTSKWNFIISKLLSSSLLSLTIFFILLLINIFIFNLHIESHIAELIVLILIVVISSSAVGILLGLLVKTNRITLPISIILSFAFFFVSGGFSSVATLPELARNLNIIIPPSYVYESIQDIILFHVVGWNYVNSLIIWIILLIIALPASYISFTKSKI
ncbi:ABC transporter permease [Priestia endophytica]|uniref:ABC-2 family transporter protein n=1 Tax=Priestia endophytica DSM 13796 TaxID=1121089 RepID=A0A1I6BUS5_9BACI|nr:ABC transporter permease [Priestia endophytica]KYG30439.1 hypothetical protein AZF06_24500 [Priestia endophytica]MBG9812131.1 hypothetical protein [Priestia endophytica]SFQ84644.1 ABC-2 family transporter protein [Priestia endophytica DSM 13796]